MKHLKQVLVIFLLFVNITSYVSANSSGRGDYATKKYSVIPPAPEVSSMMKYIDIPMSHFTGQPQIEIPIYTLNEGSLSVPITLSYRGGGIKQNELSGIISKGWTLMAGMTISRTVYGLPDECNKNPSTQYWMRGLFNLSKDGDRDLRNKLIARTDKFDPSELNQSRVQSYTECADYEKGYVDFANDIYKFYGQGMSGTFIFDENQQITMSTASPIKMDFNLGWRYGNYSMTDKDQTKYIFDLNGVETTQTPINAENYNVNVETESAMEKLVYPSAWHITQMKSLYGDVVDFVYSEPIYRNEYLGSSQYYIDYSDSDDGDLVDRSSIILMRNKYNERCLIEIKSKSAKVKFHYNSELTQLDSISIHKCDADTTRLWTYHFLRGDSGNLIQINQIGNDNSNTLPLYRFTYSSKTCNHSFAIDHWGYCNGKIDNPSMLPELSGLEHIPYKKADREPNEYYTQQGILTRISYPMGGYTDLNWEQNDYSYIEDDGGYLQPKTHSTTITTTFTLRGTEKEQCLNSGAFTMAYGDYFTIDLSKYMEPLMSGASCFQLEFQSEYETASNYHQQPYPRLDVYKDGVIYKQYDIDKNNSRSKIHITSTGATYQFVIVNPRSFYGMSETDINNFWGANPTTDYKSYGYITITRNVIKTTESSVIKPWGGLRIASIESRPTESNYIRKVYSYKTGNSYSSGKIKSEPQYTYQGHKYHSDGGIGYICASVCNIGSNGILSSTSGEIGVEYSEVWETYSGAINGEIGYFYDTHAEYPDIETCLIENYVPTGLKILTSYAFKRGNLKEKHYNGFFEETNWEKKLYKKEIYDYSIPEGSCISDFSGPLHTICDFSEIDYSDGNGDILYKNYTINKYKLIPYNKRVKSETVWEKDFFTDTESEQTVEYTYYGEENGYNSNPWNSFVKSKSYENSRGQTVTTYYTYYKIGNIPLDMKELEITVVDDIVVSARRNEYDVNNHKLIRTYTGCIGMQFSDNFTLPQSILNNATYPAIDKEEYSYTYDTQGNIVQISCNGTVLASYLWGYMGKHPIIEAVGMPYAELFDIADDYSYTDGLYIENMNLFLDSFKADKRLEDKEVLYYTYHWLLGIATATDSRGVRNTYMLDDFGRLSGVKDTNGYYINKYYYQYKDF